MRPEKARSEDEVIVQPQPGPLSGAGTITDAFSTLSQCLVETPDRAPFQLSELAMRLTGAGSAGVSLEDVDQGAPVFRWVATAGELARYANGTMPRHFSPCGIVVDRRRTVVMADPGRFYEYIRTKVHAPVEAALLVPYQRGGQYIGTLWAISHTKEACFTTSDVQALQSLAVFSSTILDRPPRGSIH